jgi:hypothetical protein
VLLIFLWKRTTVYTWLSFAKLISDLNVSKTSLLPIMVARLRPTTVSSIYGSECPVVGGDAQTDRSRRSAPGEIRKACASVSQRLCFSEYGSTSTACYTSYYQKSRAQLSLRNCAEVSSLSDNIFQTTTCGTCILELPTSTNRCKYFKKCIIGG